MAEEKKSFLLYVDLIHTIRKLPDDKAGILFKHILKYVNDENPITDDFVVDLTFEPIKQQLKRDLQKWDKHKADKSLNGRMGNLKRYHLDLFELVNSDKMNLEDAENVAKSRKVSQSDVSDRKTRLNVNDNVTVSVNDTVIVNDISFKEKNEKEISEKPIYKKVEKDGITIYAIDQKTPIEVMFENMNRLEPILMKTKTSKDSKRIQDWSNWYINKYNDYHNKLPVQLGASLQNWLEKPEPTFKPNQQPKKDKVDQALETQAKVEMMIREKYKNLEDYE